MMAILFFFAVALLALGAQASRCGQGGGESPPPNIVFLMTDDQDRLLGSMDYMETVQNEMIAKGTEFTQHYTTIAQCCPSRVGLLRGQAAHNTNITNVFAPG